MKKSDVSVKSRDRRLSIRNKKRIVKKGRDILMDLKRLTESVVSYLRKKTNQESSDTFIVPRIIFGRSGSVLKRF